MGDKISLLAIYGLAILPVFRVLDLMWLEVLRLLVITLGLFFLSIRYRGERRHSLSEDAGLQREKVLPVVLALTLMFVLIQFDPATSIMNELDAQSRLNWFFVLSTVFILLVSVSVGIRGIHSRGKRQRDRKRFSRHLTTPDIIVLICGGMAIGLSVVSKSLVSVNRANWAEYLWYVKVAECLLLWFLFTRYVSTVFDHSTALPAQSNPLCRYGVLLNVICLTFAIVISGGFGRLALALYHYDRGNAHYELGELESAKKRYQRVRVINQYLDIRSLQEKSVRRMAAVYLKSDSTDLAERILEDIRSRDSEHVALKKIGDIYFDAERWWEAKSHYQRYLKSMRGDSHVLDKVAACYIHLKDVSGLSTFISSHQYDLDLDFKDSESLIVIGRYYLEANRYDAAVRIFESADDSSSMKAYYAGKSYMGLNRVAQAKEQFGRAIDKDSGFADAYYQLGNCFESEGNLDSAQVFYEKTIELLPNHLDGLQALVEIYRLKGIE